MVIGASFGPVCGAMLADFLMSGRRWVGPRAGFNPAGWISWIVGFVVGAFNLVLPLLLKWDWATTQFPHLADYRDYVPVPPVTAFVVGFALYVVLSVIGLRTRKLLTPEGRLIELIRYDADLNEGVGSPRVVWPVGFFCDEACTASPHPAGADHDRQQPAPPIENRSKPGSRDSDTGTMMMDPAVKTAMGVCVLVAGVCVALLFRHDSPRPAASGTPSATELLIRSRAGHAARRNGAIMPVEGDSQEAAIGRRPATVVKPLDGQQSPPPLAPSNPESDRPTSPRGVASIDMLLPAAQQAHTHRIVDGDTLAASGPALSGLGHPRAGDFRREPQRAFRSRTAAHRRRIEDSA